MMYHIESPIVCLRIQNEMGPSHVFNDLCSFVWASSALKTNCVRYWRRLDRNSLRSHPPVSSVEAVSVSSAASDSAAVSAAASRYRRLYSAGVSCCVPSIHIPLFASLLCSIPERSTRDTTDSGTH